MKIEFKSVPPIRCPLCRGPYFIEEGTEYPSLACKGCTSPPEGASPIEALKDIRKGGINDKATPSSSPSSGEM